MFKKDPCCGKSGEARAQSQRSGRDSNSVLKGHGGEAGAQNRDASGPPQSQAGCRAVCYRCPWHHQLSAPSTSGSATRPPGCRELSALLPLAGTRSLPEPSVSPGRPAGTHFTRALLTSGLPGLVKLYFLGTDRAQRTQLHCTGVEGTRLATLSVSFLSLFTRPYSKLDLRRERET